MYFGLAILFKSAIFPVKHKKPPVLSGGFCIDRMLLQIGLFIFLLAVYAAVDAFFFVRETEAVRKFLLNARDATGILAL